MIDSKVIVLTGYVRTYVGVWRIKYIESINYSSILF